MTESAKSKPAEDFLLVQRIRLGGDPDAFGRLVEKYQSPLRRYLLCLTGGDGFRSDDLAQETFLRAFSSIRQYNGLGSFRAWLFRIAYRLFLDSCRSNRPAASLEYAAGKSSDLSPEMAILQSALSCLDETERHLILLSAVEQLSHGQIARVTGMPLGTVKTTLARAKSKLRVHLKNEQL